jgi:DNA-binding MarR family transcriptional regulator
VTRENRKQLVAEVGFEIRAFQTAVDAFDEAVAGRLGINRTDLRCLDLLERHGPMTAGKLAHASGLTTGAVTRLLDRLERMGYAQRVRDSADRRRVLVELTPRARERAAELYGPVAQAGQTGLERYRAEQLTLLRDFFRGARAFHEERTNQLRAHQPADRAS